MILNKLLSFLLPPQCLHCKVIVTGKGMLCGDCWRQAVFITHPFCKRCAHPLNLPANLDHPSICGPCKKYDDGGMQTRCVLVYNDLSRKLIIRFKHSDASYLASMFGQWLLNISRDWLSNADYVIPVPLHWARLSRRSYNQSALLSIYLLKACRKASAKNALNFPLNCPQEFPDVGLPTYAPHFLRRIRNTPSQACKNFVQRQENIGQAFFVPDRYKSKLINSKVILVDDVITTGATINECSRILREAGCKQIYVLAIARATKNMAEF